MSQAVLVRLHYNSDLSKAIQAGCLAFASAFVGGTFGLANHFAPVRISLPRVFFEQYSQEERVTGTFAVTKEVLKPTDVPNSEFTVQAALKGNLGATVVRQEVTPPSMKSLVKMAMKPHSTAQIPYPRFLFGQINPPFLGQGSLSFRKHLLFMGAVDSLRLKSKHLAIAQNTRMHSQVRSKGSRIASGTRSAARERSREKDNEKNTKTEVALKSESMGGGWIRRAASDGVSQRQIFLHNQMSNHGGNVNTYRSPEYPSLRIEKFGYQQLNLGIQTLSEVRTLESSPGFTLFELTSTKLHGNWLPMEFIDRLSEEVGLRQPTGIAYIPIDQDSLSYLSIQKSTSATITLQVSLPSGARIVDATWMGMSIHALLAEQIGQPIDDLVIQKIEYPLARFIPGSVLWSELTIAHSASGYIHKVLTPILLPIQLSGRLSFSLSIPDIGWLQKSTNGALIDWSHRYGGARGVCSYMQCTAELLIAGLSKGEVDRSKAPELWQIRSYDGLADDHLSFDSGRYFTDPFESSYASLLRLTAIPLGATEQDDVQALSLESYLLPRIASKHSFTVLLH